MSIHLSDKCVCGHEFQDHVQKSPRRCTEVHVNGKHACLCTSFTMRDSKRSLFDMPEREPSLAGMAYERALRSLPTALS
jgi:hypothetical protein